MSLLFQNFVSVIPVLDLVLIMHPIPLHLQVRVCNDLVHSRKAFPNEEPVRQTPENVGHQSTRPRQNGKHDSFALLHSTNLLALLRVFPSSPPGCLPTSFLSTSYVVSTTCVAASWRAVTTLCKVKQVAR